MKNKRLDKWIKLQLIDRRGNKCEICGFNSLVNILVVHHIIELQDGGTNEESNLQVLCPNCHTTIHYKECLTLADRKDYYNRQNKKYRDYYKKWREERRKDPEWVAKRKKQMAEWYQRTKKQPK